MLVGTNEAAIVFKIPRDLIAPWIAYCNKYGYTQSRMVRSAIGQFIYSDDDASDAELAMAARISDFGYGYDPRGPQEQ